MLMNFLIMMNFKLIDCKYIYIKDINKKLSPSPVILNSQYLWITKITSSSSIKPVCEKYLSSEQYWASMMEVRLAAWHLFTRQDEDCCSLRPRSCSPSTVPRVPGGWGLLSTWWDRRWNRFLSISSSKTGASQWILSIDIDCLLSSLGEASIRVDTNYCIIDVRCSDQGDITVSLKYKCW